ncbi:MAG: polyprenyl synthetase family protein [Haloechinothrix sp.]
MSDIDADLPGHVERVLAGFLREAASPVRRVKPFAEAMQALTGFVLGGGKRLRPTFAWWAWRGAGGAATGPRAAGALQAVAALELIQACALIHDDLMDDSDSRRGSPTVHVAFAKRHAEGGWHGESARFGLAASVLIGDVALAWADDMFASAPLPAETLAAARPAWRAMRTEVLAGQYLDVHTQACGDTSAEAAMWVNELKTAAYTVQRPLHIGAALAGASDELIDALLSFGKDLGIAFQLRDDLLGVFGDPDVTGKPAGDDLREGKRTFLAARGLLRARERGMTAAERAIGEAIGDTTMTEDRLAQVRTALVEVGAVDDVEHRITELTDTALASLRDAHLAEPAAGKLTELAFAATKRDR